MQLIVPYRDRLEHLEKFAEHYKGFDILVVEQSEGKPFNRGKLCNIGTIKSTTNSVFFHDVDLLAHDNAIYSIVKSSDNVAVHLSGLCEQFNYEKTYEKCFGGVTYFHLPSFLKANGFSNNYWGWGGEDDDLRERCKLAGIPIIFEWHKFYSQPHPHAGSKHPNYQRNVQNLKNVANNWKHDGLNTLSYSIVEEYSLCGLRTIKVDL